MTRITLILEQDEVRTILDSLDDRLNVVSGLHEENPGDAVLVDVVDELTDLIARVTEQADTLP